MRKLILQMQVSLDGFVAGPKGELDWIFADFDGGLERWTIEKLWQAGAHLMGSATYRDMAAYWPNSGETFAAPMNQIPKVVFSRSPLDASWPETRVMSGNLAEAVARLKSEAGGDLLAHGGTRFAQSLVRAGLIDDYRLIVHPIALGNGLRLFPDSPMPIRLKLVEAIPFESGAIAMTYRS